MSDTDVKPSPHKKYSTIYQLLSPNDKSNWDTWSFAMRMMLSSKNLEYVIEGGSYLISSIQTLQLFPF